MVVVPAVLLVCVLLVKLDPTGATGLLVSKLSDRISLTCDGVQVSTSVYRENIFQRSDEFTSKKIEFYVSNYGADGATVVQVEIRCPENYYIRAFACSGGKYRTNDYGPWLFQTDRNSLNSGVNVLSLKFDQVPAGLRYPVGIAVVSSTRELQPGQKVRVLVVDDNRFHDTVDIDLD